MPDLTEFRELVQKQKTVTLKVYSDPGHGWLTVPIQLLLKVNPVISPWSYINNSGKTVFLEEDRDAGAFIEKAKTMGITVKQKCTWTNKQSKIRNYRNYSLNWKEENAH